MDDDVPESQPPSGSTLGVIALGVVIGLIVAAGVIWSTRSDDDRSASSTAPVDTPTTTTSISEDPAQRNADAVDLVVAYGRSRTEVHALTGEVRRPDQTPLAVRRAIAADRAIDEVGSTAAVTEAGTTRQCEQIEGQWLCAPPLPAISPEMDTQGFATLFLTEEPTYAVFEVSTEPPEALASITELGSVTCWSFVSDGRVDRSRFGAETTMCFHDDLGALVGRVTETSVGQDVFVADSLRAEVDVVDVEPSR